MPSVVHTILLETGLAPGRLELEITECVLIDDFSHAISILRRLKALGVRIAMDDFGTCYSSLSCLQSFPFEKFKIDQSFVSKLASNPQSAAIIRAMIGLGRGLPMRIVAEGVETEDQLTFLREEHCDEVQGYFIGRPHPINGYAELVGRSNVIYKSSSRANSGWVPEQQACIVPTRQTPCGPLANRSLSQPFNSRRTSAKVRIALER